MVSVIVVTGFLGSGKTSLLAHVLDGTPDNPPCVVVNELDATSVDPTYLEGGEHVVAGNDGRIRAVSGGPLTGDRLTAALRQVRSLAETFAQTAVIIETSGASPVAPLVAALLEASDLQLVRIVAVVDASLLRHRLGDALLRDLVTAQLAAADVVIANKWDRAGLVERIRVRRTLRRLAPGALLLAAEYGRVPPETVLPGANDGQHGETTPTGSCHRATTPRRYTARVAPDKGLDTEQQLTVTHVGHKRPFHPARLDAVLRMEWPGVVRVKGFAWLATDMAGVYVVDVAGPQREVGLEATWLAALPESERPPAGDGDNSAGAGPFGDRRQALTVIGTEAGTAYLRDAFAHALLTDEEFAVGPEAWAAYRDPVTPRFADKG